MSPFALVDATEDFSLHGKVETRSAPGGHPELPVPRYDLTWIWSGSDLDLVCPLPVHPPTGIVPCPVFAAQC